MNPVLKLNLQRLLFSLLCFTVSIYYMALGNVFTEKVAVANETREALYTNPDGTTFTVRRKNLPVSMVTLSDTGFKFSERFTPFLSDPKCGFWRNYPDYALYAMFGVFVLFFILNISKHHIIILKRMFFISSYFALLRGTCMMLTQLPLAHWNTMYGKFKVHNIWTDAFWIMIGVKKANHDFFFSAHTGFFTLFTLFMVRYRERWLSHPIFSYILKAMNFWNIYTIMATKFHYSIDVIVAYFLMWFLFNLYHGHFVDTDTKVKKFYFFLFENKPFEAPGMRKIGQVVNSICGRKNVINHGKTEQDFDKV